MLRVSKYLKIQKDSNLFLKTRGFKWVTSEIWKLFRVNEIILLKIKIKLFCSDNIFKCTLILWNKNYDPWHSFNCLIVRTVYNYI